MPTDTRINTTPPREAPSFFLRFYGPAVRNIEACVAEMRARFPQITGHTTSPLTKSINAVVPPGSKEVHLQFRTEADRDTVRDSADGKAIYLRYAQAAHPGAVFADRRPEDKCFGPVVAAEQIFRPRMR